MFETFKKLKYGLRICLNSDRGRSETINVAGRATVIRSAGDGPPFVYLHSTLAESFVWFPFFHTWSKEFRVLVPTHPGFGESEGFDEIDSIEDMAFHYIELFDALGLERVILGGVSLGGWIAAEIATRWPERVKRLWLSGAPGLWVENKRKGELFRVMHDRDKLRKMLFHDPESTAARMVVQDDPSIDRMLAAYQSLTVLARLAWERPYNPKLASRLHRIQCPVLLVWGANDELVPPEFGEEYAKYLPQAQMKLIPECGHMVMFEREAEFVEEVAAFARDTTITRG